MNDVYPSTAVPLLEHGLIYHQGGFNVFRCFPNIPLNFKVGVGKETRVGVEPPLHAAGICTSLICFRPSFEYHMWMFLLKNRKAVQSHIVHKGSINRYCKRFMKRKGVNTCYNIFDHRVIPFHVFF